MDVADNYTDAMKTAISNLAAHTYTVSSGTREYQPPTDSIHVSFSFGHAAAEPDCSMAWSSRGRLLDAHGGNEAHVAYTMIEEDISITDIAEAINGRDLTAADEAVAAAVALDDSLNADHIMGVTYVSEVTNSTREDGSPGNWQSSEFTIYSGEAINTGDDGGDGSGANSSGAFRAGMSLLGIAWAARFAIV